MQATDLLGLDAAPIGALPDDLAEDIGVLQARLAKDAALAQLCVAR